MTGTEPITVASAALQDESAATDLNVPSIIAAASGFALAAAAHSDYMRKQTSEVLNKHGRSLRKIKVGDHVKAVWEDGCAYPASIQSIGKDNTITVIWKDDKASGTVVRIA